MAAQNQVGTGEHVYLQQDVTTEGIPEAPRNLTATKGTNPYITLQWEEPDDDGECDITGYIVEMRRRDFQQNRTEAYQYCREATVDALRYHVHNFTPGTSHTFRVAAQNDVGTSEYVYLETKCPPSPPQNPAASGITRTGVTLRWEAPSADGGTPITGYILDRSKDGQFSQSCDQLHEDQSEDCTACNTKATTVNALQHQVDDLKPGTTYVFRVAAQNNFSISDYVYLRQPVRTDGPPNLPQNPTAEIITKTGVTLRWEKPTEDWGAPITGYIIQQRKESTESKDSTENKGSTESRSSTKNKRSTKSKGSIENKGSSEGKGSTPPYTPVATVQKLLYNVEHLQPDTTYRFRVAAKNKFETSQYVYLQQPVKTDKEKEESASAFWCCII